MAKLSEHPMIGEAAERLGASMDTLWSRWNGAAKLKARRHPMTGYRLYLKKELDAILAGALEPAAARATPRKRRKRQRG